jgi:hypothetical protein
MSELHERVQVIPLPLNLGFAGLQLGVPIANAQNLALWLSSLLDSLGMTGWFKGMETPEELRQRIRRTPQPLARLRLATAWLADVQWERTGPLPQLTRLSCPPVRSPRA